MAEPGATQRRVAIALAIAAFLLASAALVVAIARRSDEPVAIAPARPIAQKPPAIRQLDATHAVIARDTVDQLIADPSQVQVTLRGMTLEAFPPGSVLAQLGFQPGDTIRGVNGMNVATPGEALGIYMQLKSTTRLTIDLDRHGEAMQLTIDIR